MSIQKVRAYMEPLGIADRIREFDVSSATVELAAVAVSRPTPEVTPVMKMIFLDMSDSSERLEVNMLQH